MYLSSVRIILSRCNKHNECKSENILLVHMRVCVLVQASGCVCMCMQACVCVNACGIVRACVQFWVCTNACMHECACKCASVQVCVSVCECDDVFKCECVWVCSSAIVFECECVWKTVCSSESVRFECESVQVKCKCSSRVQVRSCWVHSSWVWARASVRGCACLCVFMSMYT